MTIETGKTGQVNECKHMESHHNKRQVKCGRCGEILQAGEGVRILGAVSHKPYWIHAYKNCSHPKEDDEHRPKAYCVDCGCELSQKTDRCQPCLREYEDSLRTQREEARLEDPSYGRDPDWNTSEEDLRAEVEAEAEREERW